MSKHRIAEDYWLNGRTFRGNASTARSILFLSVETRRAS